MDCHLVVRMMNIHGAEKVKDNKYFYTTHSELNAILNYRGGSLEDAKIYVTLFPCNECAKAIIQSGIKEIIYDDDKYQHTPSVIASKRMLKSAGVKTRKIQTNRKKRRSSYVKIDLKNFLNDR